MLAVPIKIKRLNKHLPLPEYSTPGSSCLDLLASITVPVLLERGVPKLITVGIAIELPDGYEGQVRPRSGLALNHGVTVLNTPGTIDSDYRGEISVILVNHRLVPYTVNPGDRIAQLIIVPVLKTIWNEVSELLPTKRGSGGYGSTGY